jgi:AraC-like DNA-binding protein
MAPRETCDDAASEMHARSSGLEPLAAVIALLRPQTVLSKVISGAGRWSVQYAAHVDPAFCVVLDGSCFLAVDGAAVIELAQGDFVLLPATPGFTLASDLQIRPTRRTPGAAGDLRHGTKTGLPTMRMLGGNFQFDRGNAQLLLKLMPSIVHIRRDEPGAERLRQTAALIAEETRTQRPGRDSILERLVEVLLIEALRFRPVSAARQEHGLLAGLADPALARALQRMHADVARRWTVAELARVAGMSRAVFAERFTRMVGMPPMQYLLEWRIAIAKDLLRRERPPLAEVAARIGYQSASAFSTSFSRVTGCSPSDFSRVDSQ